MLYMVSPLSRENLRGLAEHIRKQLGLVDDLFIDIVRIVENLHLIDEKFEFLIWKEEEMGDAHAITNPSEHTIIIREDVYRGACRGSGRDRFTLAHEFGHYVLHDGVAIGLARSAEATDIPRYRDPEWQASAFAGELLMPPRLIKGMPAWEIAKRCGVSDQAASFQLRFIK